MHSWRWSELGVGTAKHATNGAGNFAISDFASSYHPCRPSTVRLGSRPGLSRPPHGGSALVCTAVEARPNVRSEISGDILFVAAGVEHHYEDFSEDLALWRIFYGRRGGEIPA